MRQCEADMHSGRVRRRAVRLDKRCGNDRPQGITLRDVSVLHLHMSIVVVNFEDRKYAPPILDA